MLNIALQADGFGLSDRATAAIVSATLVDFGLSEKGPVDRSKIKKLQLRENVIQSGLYFDGRKDKTLQKSGFYSNEEHISIISEPESQYIDHVTPKSGKSEAIVEAFECTLHWL